MHCFDLADNSDMYENIVSLKPKYLRLVLHIDLFVRAKITDFLLISLLDIKHVSL